MIKKITVKGAVQGVGYRPFIAEMATEYGLKGSVKNIGAAVEIIVAGDEDTVSDFISRIRTDMPPGAFILSVDISELPENEEASYSEKSFEIIRSDTMDMTGEIPVFLPDIGICDDCMREMLDPGNRRYRHALISCAVCGPRVSILNRLPYDRENTTMEEFELCSGCREEYGSGRRWYAQTISCNVCGPRWGYVHRYTNKFFNEFIEDKGLRMAADVVKKHGIIGFKGVSGFQIMCLPGKEEAERLREIKGRENKPFAIMYPTIEAIKEDAFVSSLEEKLLTSSARPIVLLKKKRQFSDAVDKGSDYIGAFLPSSGMHRLILDETGPLIVTSGNISDSPIINDDYAFDKEFEAILDGQVFTNRYINIPQDDSVMFVINTDHGEEQQFIRRARGFYPLPVVIDKDKTAIATAGRKNVTVLAMGGDLKGTAAVACGNMIMPSQHIGDLQDLKTMEVYKKIIDDFSKIYMKEPEVIVSDLHPGYNSSIYAKELSREKNIENIKLQHHFAHTYSVMAENSLRSAIGVSFDGTGYGLDGNIWGGEFIFCDNDKPKRLGHLSYVKLAGGDHAPKDAHMVSRCFLFDCSEKGLLPEEFLDKAFENDDPSKLNLIRSAYAANVNTFLSSGMGRLFDAVSDVLDIASYNSYEGECAIKLEQRASAFEESHMEGGKRDVPAFGFNIKVADDGTFEADETALFADIMHCIHSGSYTADAIAYGFHMAVVDLIYSGCVRMSETTGEKNVCLSGGVFNNRIILKKTVDVLSERGFNVYWNQQVPLGDGGISLGQAYYGLLKTGDMI